VRWLLALARISSPTQVPCCYEFSGARTRSLLVVSLASVEFPVSNLLALCRLPLASSRVRPFSAQPHMWRAPAARVLTIGHSPSQLLPLCGYGLICSSRSLCTIQSVDALRALRTPPSLPKNSPCSRFVVFLEPRFARTHSVDLYLPHQPYPFS
jgi:hypothetical protein